MTKATPKLSRFAKRHCYRRGVQEARMLADVRQLAIK